MLTLNMKTNPLYKIPSNTLVSLPAPSNLSLSWNFGSLLGLMLMSQIITGLMLASLYSPNMDLIFEAMSRTMELTDMTWLMRYTHMNGASVFFILMYMHIGRGIYYASFSYKHTWMTGTTLLLLSMATAFLGYVLPMNQMSFWGASVITNLFSEVPYIGQELVHFIWGGVSIHNPTITRFFTIHFLLPFIILAMMMIHITMLHQTGSNNPLGLKSSIEKSSFHPQFSMKDIMGVFTVITLTIILVFYFPLIFGDNENFGVSLAAVTPLHIQPEWYFLFAYSILRSVPNKLGGVLALTFSVLLLYSLPYTMSSPLKSTTFNLTKKIIFWSMLGVVMCLSWIGANPVEPPFIILNQILSSVYFIFYLIFPLNYKL